MKKNKNSLVLIAGAALILIASTKLFTESDSSISEKEVTPVQNRGIASVESSSQQVDQNDLIFIKELDIRNQKVFNEFRKRDTLSTEDFKREVAEISKKIGWDLVVEKTEDGRTHIKTKQAIEDLSSKDLPAFSAEEWTTVQENLLTIINDGRPLDLNRDDHIALEKWNTSN
jgi:hypothetical protein